MNSFDRSRIDGEIRPIVEALAEELGPTRRETYLQFREMSFPFEIPANISSEQIIIKTNDGDLRITLYRPKSTQTQAAILWMHGGGHIMGTEEDTLAPTLTSKLEVAVFSVNYRLSPEYTYVESMEDCYIALAWLFANADEMNIDKERIAIAGASAGGGKCAGLALMNRDRDDYPLRLQALLCPMLDNLHDTDSGNLEGHLMWDRKASIMAWEMYLGGTPGHGASPYASPTRAEDLSDLPPAHISIGSEDLFRDECIEYAKRLYLSNTPCELTVFPGVTHGGDIFAPEAKVTKRYRQSYIQGLRDALT